MPTTSHPARTLLCVVALATAGAAQQAFVQNYTELEGLPSSRVHDVREAPSGLLWFATRAGLHAYDGTSWTPRLAELIPRKSPVLFVRFDAAGDPWALCGGGQIVTTSPTLEEPLPGLGPLRGSAFQCDLELYDLDGAPRPLVADSTLGLLAWDGRAWSILSLPQGGRVLGIEPFLGRMYVATTTGLHVLRDGAVVPAPCAAELPGGAVRGLCADRDDPALWVLGDDWLCTVDAAGAVATVAADLPSLARLGATPVRLTPDGRGGALYGNPWSLLHLDGRTLGTRVLGPADGLAAGGVNALARDASGLLWVASDLGVSKILTFDAFTLTGHAKRQLSEVSAAIELPDGRLVLASVGALAVQLGDDAGAWREVRFGRVDPGMQGSSRVMDLCLDGSGGLCIAASRLGVGFLDAEADQPRWVPFPAELDTWANAIRPDGDGGFLVGTHSGLLRLREGRFEPVPVGDLGHPFVRRIERGRDGAIYLATTGGVCVGRDGRWRRLRSTSEPLGQNQFYTCFEDSSGRVWCGGADGLWRLEGDRLARGGPAYDVRRPVYALTQDRRGRLWIGTDLGVEFSDGERLVPLDWLARHTGHDVNRGAALCDRRGRVWIGTSRGAAVFEESFDVPSDPPRVELLAVEVGQEALPLDRPVRLRADRTAIAFHVRALTYLADGEVEIRSRVAGLTDWQTRRGPTVHVERFGGLPPGRYRFEARARVPGGRLSPIVRSPPVIVLGPLWSRWWFKVGLVAATAVLSIVFYRSVSRRRHAEWLEHEVEVRTRDLESSLRELAKTTRLRSLGLLAGGIAHDLRTVLTVLTGNLSLLDVRARSGPRDAARLEAIDQALERATQLASQLQTFATGGAPMTSPVSMADVARESSELVLSGSRVSLDLDLADDLWAAEADPAQVRQVLENLLINARQAQPSGGRVRVRGRNLVLPAGGPEDAAQDLALPPGRYVAFEVTDAGQGIPEEVAQRMFDPFFTTKEEGSGLGLATALSIARRHGGSLSFVPSGPDGAGATFRLVLPASSRRAAPAEAELPPPLPAGPRIRRVLVVDDEFAIRELLGAMLARLGYEPSAAGSSAEARRLAERAREEGRPFQAAVLDFTLPGDLDGPRILELLRRIEPGLRAVASSGYSRDAQLAQYHEQGFQAALPKPYGLAEVARAMLSLEGGPAAAARVPDDPGGAGAASSADRPAPADGAPGE